MTRSQPGQRGGTVPADQGLGRQPPSWRERPGPASPCLRLTNAHWPRWRGCGGPRMLNSNSGGPRSGIPRPAARPDPGVRSTRPLVAGHRRVLLTPLLVRDAYDSESSALALATVELFRRLGGGVMVDV